MKFNNSMVAIILCLAIGLCETPAADPVRVATFNISFNRREAGGLLKDLKAGNDQAKDVASILREVRPDIVLLNEFDYDATGTAVKTFQTDYLEATDGEGEPLKYEFSFIAAVNTGVPSGIDFDNNGRPGDPNDAYGFGFFPGQYGMAVLSRFPIMADDVRTFQNLLWTSMPDAALPQDPDTKKSWYSDEALKTFRLSSKSHWDVPIDVNGKVIHLLASHPTPPAFDGEEDRNGHRNHDEIRLLAEYISSSPNADWLTDDKGNTGRLPAAAPFVIVGDLNADPTDGSSYQNAIDQLLKHPRVNPLTPASTGAVEASKEQGQINLTHKGEPKFDTADFSDRSVGNLRVDYALPSKNLTVKGSGVFWPEKNKPLGKAVKCTDHRLVWVDLAF